jgi:hypothetical protein
MLTDQVLSELDKNKKLDINEDKIDLKEILPKQKRKNPEEENSKKRGPKKKLNKFEEEKQRKDELNE